MWDRNLFFLTGIKASEMKRDINMLVFFVLFFCICAFLQISGRGLGGFRLAQLCVNTS